MNEFQSLAISIQLGCLPAHCPRRNMNKLRSSSNTTGLKNSDVSRFFLRFPKTALRLAAGVGLSNVLNIFRARTCSRGVLLWLTKPACHLISSQAFIHYSRMTEVLSSLQYF